MAIVAGVDFGTLSVRVTLVDSKKGPIGTASATYPLHRRRDDPNYATQSHADQMAALAAATRDVLKTTGIDGAQVAAIALDTTGSSVIPVGEGLEPLDEYYLWCDHRAFAEAEEITRKAHELGFEGIEWCGGVYSHEWGFAKLLALAAAQSEKKREICDGARALRHGGGDAVRASPTSSKLKRSVCAMGHKWMWNPKWGGLPPEEFLVAVDPLFAGVRAKLGGEYLTSDRHRRASFGKMGRGARAARGNSDSCGRIRRALGRDRLEHSRRRCGERGRHFDLHHRHGAPGGAGSRRVRRGAGKRASGYTGIEAGLSAVGDIFDAIARRAGTTVAALSEGLDAYKAGQTGLLRLSWDNGDRTVLVNPELGGVTLGWNLVHTAQDELFAAIEGTAFHTRIILERMAEHGVRIDRVINAGGIPQKNEVLNRVYANVLNKPVLVPAGIPTSLGSGIFALLAAGAYKTIEEAQAAVCLPLRTVEPDTKSAAVYEQLYPLYRDVYFALGTRDAAPVALGNVLPELRKIAAEARKA